MLRLFSVLIVGCAALAAVAQQAPDVPLPTVAERAQLYQRIASLESTAELAKLARATAASTDAARREELALLLERHFELDPAGTVRLVSELYGGANAALAALWYGRLARADVNAALAALSQLDDAMEAGAAARAVFNALGGDARARELVAVSLRGSAQRQFRADTLGRLAATSPSEAFTEALALPDAERQRSAIMEIVAQWATVAPREAIDRVNAVQDPQLRALLKSMVLQNWRDLDDLAAYLAGLDVESRRAALASGSLGRLIQQDPQRAAGLLADLPDGNERRALEMQIASLYAQKDPEAALAWVRTLAAPNPSLVQMVVRNIAGKDPSRAFDLVGSLEEPVRLQAYHAVVSAPLKDEAQFAALADRVRGMQDGGIRTSLLVALANSWPSRPGNAQRALDWMLGAGPALPPEMFQRVGYTYAQSDPAGAAAYADRVPREARPAWVTGVTAAYAQSDLQSATIFLERFRGEPAFDRAAIMVTQQLAMSDPAAAARLLASVETRGPEGPTPEITIAREWARRDPAAALTWALDLPPMTRNMVMQLTAATLSQQDMAVLEPWVLGLPAGEKRDVALGAVIRARGAAPPNASLIGAFSDDRARQSALMMAVLATAQADPAEARRLIERHITDPRMRTQAEQVVESIARGDPAFTAGAPARVPGAPTPSFNGAGPPAFGPPGFMPPGVVRDPVTGQPMPVIRSPLGGPILVPGPVSEELQRAIPPAAPTTQQPVRE